MSMGLQQTFSINEVRADFHRSDFETLIQQKGREVNLEKGYLCPCKSKNTNQQSNCKNCGGTGWYFVNQRTTRLILQGMKITPNFKAWSMEIAGDLQVTASDTEQLSFMDRFTINDGKAIFNEVLFFKTKGSVRFAYTAYNIKDLLYVGFFAGVDTPIQKLVYGTDYTFDKNIIRLINPAIVAIQGEVSVTVRYIHAPMYYMIEMKRESMESWEVEGGNEKLIHLPIAGTARRAHYILDAPNLLGDRLLDNSYVEVPLPSSGCE